MNSRARAFPPVADPEARLLILGSIPGQASLAAQQYYAHPRNAFWPILCAHLGLPADSAYEARIAALRAGGIALWDVLHSCQRPGSLDAAIAPDSMVANDFAAFFAVHRKIVAIGFNGGTAEQSFRRLVLPTLPETLRQQLRLHRLPSTSPAHAALSLEDKAGYWQRFLVRSFSGDQCR